MYFQATSVLSLAMAAGALAQFRLQVRPSFQARQLDQQISAVRIRCFDIVILKKQEKEKY